VGAVRPHGVGVRLASRASGPTPALSDTSARMLGVVGLVHELGELLVDHRELGAQRLGAAC
jgi:hypothetical protein